MATPEEEEAAKKARKTELAEAFADGMEIFSNREAERKKKNPPEGDEGNNDGNGDGNNQPQRRSLGEWLLGYSPSK